MIYLVWHEHTPYIKIGKADDIISRIASLQTGTPNRLLLLAHCDGGLKKENQIHMSVRVYRTAREWFYLPHDTLRQIVDAFGFRKVEPNYSTFMLSDTSAPTKPNLFNQHDLAKLPAL